MDAVAPEELGPQGQLREALDAPTCAPAVPDQVALDEQRPPSRPVPALSVDVRPDPSVELRMKDMVLVRAPCTSGRPPNAFNHFNQSC